MPGEGGPWIIPARAGFTFTPTATALPSPDHPRSRGVYSLPEIVTVPVVGSSPLARGLLERPNDPRPRRGIIPARAGFTVKTRSVARQLRDHPRSRGVYPTADELNKGIHGSSPLARGLPYSLVLPGVWRGIIPARAGFTYRQYILRRGVKGSSPLARGLRVPECFSPLRLRIIPARAGFTARPRRPAHITRDHPRSRGVYDDCTITIPS